MARIFETKNIAFPDDKRADMQIMCANTQQKIYKDFGIGLEINDGRFINAVDDDERS